MAKQFTICGARILIAAYIFSRKSIVPNANVIIKSFTDELLINALRLGRFLEFRADGRCFGDNYV